MRDRSRTGDLNELAFRLVKDTTEKTDAAEMSEEELRSIAAAALGRRGGLKGGPARAARLSPERRREIARKAARIRWETEKSRADSE